MDWFSLFLVLFFCCIIWFYVVLSQDPESEWKESGIDYEWILIRCWKPQVLATGRKQRDRTGKLYTRYSSVLKVLSSCSDKISCLITMQTISVLDTDLSDMKQVGESIPIFYSIEYILFLRHCIGQTKWKWDTSPLTNI